MQQSMFPMWNGVVYNVACQCLNDFLAKRPFFANYYKYNLSQAWPMDTCTNQTAEFVVGKTRVLGSGCNTPKRAELALNNYTCPIVRCGECADIAATDLLASLPLSIQGNPVYVCRCGTDPRVADHAFCLVTQEPLSPGNSYQKIKSSVVIVDYWGQFIYDKCYSGLQYSKSQDSFNTAYGDIENASILCYSCKQPKIMEVKYPQKMEVEYPQMEVEYP